MKASNRYTEVQLADLVAQAMIGAETTFEFDFVDGIAARFYEYGAKMYLTEKQDALLREIASMADAT